MPRILVTNDDGVHAPGIKALAEALRPLGDVVVVAPHQESSAIGHALTLRRPLRLETFGPEIYARFRRLKSELDPRGLFNRGAVFAAP